MSVRVRRMWPTTRQTVLEFLRVETSHTGYGRYPFLGQPVRCLPAWNAVAFGYPEDLVDDVVVRPDRS